MDDGVMLLQSVVAPGTGENLTVLGRKGDGVEGLGTQIDAKVNPLALAANQ